MKRFWDKVEKTDICWNWTGCLRGKTGYGCIKYKGAVIDTHRFVWFLTYGRSPEKWVAHLCNNRKCVNPDHLMELTPHENALRTERRGKMHRVKQWQFARGERSSAAKLTAKQVLEIREKGNGEANWKISKQLAPQYSVSTRCVYGILSRQTWKHI